MCVAGCELLYPLQGSLTLLSAGVQNHGVEGFLHGLAPRLLRRAMMAALSWTVYEQASFKPAVDSDFMPSVL